MSVSVGAFEPESDAPFEAPTNAAFPVIRDMHEYYALPSLPGAKQMYVWSMSLASLDGVISTAESSERGTSGLGHVQYLRQLRLNVAELMQSESSSQRELEKYQREIKSITYGKRADWRLLQMGWAQADAVLGSGAILRDEPNVKWQPIDDDLVAYRKELKSSEWKGPIQVVLTSSGDIDINHAMIMDADVRVYILTTSTGFENISNLALKAGTDLDRLATERHSHVVNLQKSGAGQIEMRDVLDYLAESLGVKYLDVTAGGLVIGKLIELNLLDEIRVTLATQILGQTNSQGLPRPTWFSGLSGSNQPVPLPPSFSMAALRMLGAHFVNLRMIKDIDL